MPPLRFRFAVASASASRFGRQRAQSRRALLEAARRVLASKGYHGAEIADIAREADVGAGTFYLDYKTKEAERPTNAGASTSARLRRNTRSKRGR